MARCVPRLSSVGIRGLRACLAAEPAIGYPTAPGDVMVESQAPLPAGARLVVIDDDLTFLDLMRELLEVSEGYEVDTYTQWRDAHTFVRARAPDLVLLDLVIQGEEHGWQVLDELSADPATRAIPVIVCSAAIRSLQDHETLL